MKCEVHFTRSFWDDVDGESRGAIRSLAAQIEKVGLRENGAIPYFEPLGRCFFKKRVGNRRLLAYVLPFDVVGRQAVLMLQYVPRGAAQYEPDVGALLERHRAEIERVTREVAASPAQPGSEVKPLPPVPDELLYFVHPNRVGMTVCDDRTHTVYLTASVVRAYGKLPKAQQVDLQKALREIVDAPATEHGELQELDCPQFTVYHTRVFDRETTLKEDIVWGIVPRDGSTEAGQERERIDQQFRQFMEDFRAWEERGQSDRPRGDLLSRYADRAFPWYILADDELLESAFEDRESFLALSSEEMRVLERAIVSEDLPLVIEGRAGSGKSTLLNYYMAEKLGSLDQRDVRHLNARFVLYVTQSKRLLERADSQVQRLLERILAELGGNRLPAAESTLADFQTYHEFAVQQLPPELRGRYAERERRGGYIDFPRFRDLLHRDPPQKAKVSGVSPEAAWFVIRSYIKGYKIHEQGDDRWMTPEEYDGETVSRKDRQVSADLYRLVWEKIWPWYRQRTIEPDAATGVPRYWDDLDLAWDVLHSRRSDAVGYLGIVCDEIQDLSRVEIAALIRSLLWFDYDLSKLCMQAQFRLPVLLAGDAHQTVHPSAFRWDRVSADLTSAIYHHVPVLNRFSPKEAPLRFNYRNAPSIAELCNGLQNLRQTTIGGRADLQRVWRIEDKVANQRVRRIVVEGPKGGDVVRELLDAGVFFIGPEDDDPDLETTRQFWESLGVQRDRDRENYVTPAEIKGLEQGCVAILGFGATFAQKCPQDFWKWRNASEDEQIPEDQRFRVEHFLNNLYVAASRASEQLWIVDTRDGWEAFWEPLRQQLEGGLKAEGCSFTCSDGDSVELVRASRGEWPTLAKDLETLAHDQRNPDHAERAAFYYQRAEDELAARKMLAYAKRYRGELAAAAEEIENIEPHTAASWRWEACQWSALAAMATIEPWRRELARLMAEVERLQRPDAPPAEKVGLEDVICNIASAFVRLWRDGRTDVTRGGGTPWLRIMQVLLDHYEAVLEKSDSLAPNDLGAIEAAAEEFAPYVRDRRQWSRWWDTLARIAFRQQQFEKSVHRWENGGLTNIEGYYIAKARTTNYPERLRWLESAGRFEELWEESARHADVPVSTADQRRIARAATECGKWREALMQWALLDARGFEQCFIRSLKGGAGTPGIRLSEVPRLMRQIYGKLRSALPLDKVGRRWSDLVFGAVVALCVDAEQSEAEAIATQLVKEFGRGVHGNAIAEQFGSAWANRDKAVEPWRKLKAVLPLLCRATAEHARAASKNRQWRDAANFASLAFDLIWQRTTSRPVSLAGEGSRRFFIRPYILSFAEEPGCEQEDAVSSGQYGQRPDSPEHAPTLSGIGPQSWDLVESGMRAITDGPDGWVRDHAARAGKSGSRLARDLEQLSKQLIDDFAQLPRGNTSEALAVTPVMWAWVGRLAEQSVPSDQAIDFYTSLRDYGETQGWPEEVLRTIRQHLERYGRRHDQWKSDSLRSNSGRRRTEPRRMIVVGQNEERDNGVIRVRHFGPLRTARVEVLADGLGVRFEAGSDGKACVLRAEEGLNVEGPQSQEGRQVWQVTGQGVRMEFEFDPSLGELRVRSGSDQFVVPFRPTV